MELVFDLRHRDGHPVDASGRGVELSPRNVGSAPGVTTGSRAMAFDGRSSRLSVLPSAVPGDLRAVRVSSWTWTDDLVGRQTVMEAYLAFALFVDADGSIGATMYNGFDWGGVRTDAGIMPVRRWVHMTLDYDGRDTSTIELDGHLVAEEAAAYGPVRAAHWPYGVSIGAWPDADKRVFSGRLDEVRLWRG
jgi:hypothetical protein